MSVKQLSAFVENKPGALVNILKTISDAQVNIRAMSIADTKDFGILRVISSDAEKTKEALAGDCLVNLTDVVAAEMKDEAGSLYNILSTLGEAGINIEYMYAFTASTDLGAYVVIRVDDCAQAEKVLNDNGIATLDEKAIASL